jgi:predicted DNA-binding transcriptional regulator AlpA
MARSSMPQQRVYLRFSDLKASQLVRSWPQLKRMVTEYGFPPGRMLTPNCRVWTSEEVDAYVASRPVEGPPLRGVAVPGRKRGRPRKDAAPAAPVARVGAE